MIIPRFALLSVHDKYKVRNCWCFSAFIKRFGVEDYITIRLDSKAPTLTSGFHEKIMIIDNQIAFCGGQDLSLGKWDISDHEFDNPSRDLGSEPWHDIHTIVEGHTVWT